VKNSKKLFAVLLAVIFAFSVVAVSASAAGTATGDEWMTVTITTDKGADTYEAGDTVVVTVSVACNYNMPVFRFPILFDKNVLEQKANIAMTAANTCASVGSLRNNLAPDESVFPENYDSTEWGCILFQWTSDVKDGAIGCINAPEGEVVFSFELKVKTGAVGTGTILIPAESNLIYYMAYEDPAVATSDYYMSSETCVTNFVPANVSVAVPDVKLIPNEDYESTAVIDEDNLFVYGLGLGIGSNSEVKEYVKATGGAAIRSTVTAEEAYGTGATINLTLNGTTVKTYTMIIFGDIDGDADITSGDLIPTLSYISGALDFDSIQLFASDVSGFDGEVDMSDYVTILAAVSGSYDIDQQGPAAV